MADDRQPVPAYRFDPDTGILLFPDLAHPDPMDQESYLLPASSTTVAPPTTGANQAAVWLDSAWSVVADFRGPVFNTTDGSKTLITELGPIPSGFTALDPTVVPHAIWNGSAWATDDSAQTIARWADIRRKRNNLLSDCDWTQGNDSPLSTDKKSLWLKYRTLLRDVPQTYSADPTTVVWPTAPA